MICRKNRAIRMIARPRTVMARVRPRFVATPGHLASWPCFPLAGQNQPSNTNPSHASIQTFWEPA